MQSIVRRALGLGALMLVAGGASAAHAGAFALKERSARAQGLSFAGASAGSGGITSMGFNPATIALATETELAGGISLIYPRVTGDVTVGGVPTGETVEPGNFAGVANGYVAHRLDDQFLIGAMMVTPFGLTTKYEPTFTGAGDALTSKLITIQISPVVAFQPIPELTLAFAGHIFHVDARLSSAPLVLDGDQTTVGFSVGALWQATPSTTIGIAFDYGYELELKGTAQGPAVGGAILPLTAYGQLPATVSVGIAQGITEDIRLFGEVQWQNWSVFDRLDINIDTPLGTAALVDPQNYEDAFYVAAGIEYDWSDALTLRTGAAWDQTPTVDSDFLTGGTTLGRTPRVPDGDRIWLSIGASYDVNDHMTLDVGYSYLFTPNEPVIDLRTAPGASVVIDGKVHILSVGGSLRF